MKGSVCKGWESLFQQAAAFCACQATEKFPVLITGHKSCQSMMQQINRGGNVPKEEKEQISPEKSFVSDYARSQCLRLDAFPAPPEDVQQKKFMLQKKVCWFLSAKHFCPLYRNRQIDKVTMTTTKQRGRHALQKEFKLSRTAQRDCANSFIATVFFEK